MSIVDRNPAHVTLTNLRLVGEFTSFEHWVNKARSWTEGGDYLFVDAAGRVCRIGKHFMRTRDEGTFPVTFYEVLED